MSIRMFTTAAFLALTAAACASAPAPVGNGPADPTLDGVVRAQLDHGAVELAEQGYALQGSYRGGALNDGGRDVISIRLSAGGSYLIVGVCDADCDDLDLVLRDGAGRLVGADYEPDDVPIVTAEPSATADYELTIMMASCSIEPCGWGVAVFARR